MILIIRVVYALLIVSTINTLLFFWPLTFFFGWSFVSYKFLLFTTNKAWDYIRNIVVFDKQEKQQQIKQKKSKFDSEEERKLYYLTKFNTIINKTLPENIDKQADMIHMKVYGKPYIKPLICWRREKKQLKVNFSEQLQIKVFDYRYTIKKV